MRKLYLRYLASIESLKIFKYTFSKKTVVSIICSKCKNWNEKIFQEEGSIDQKFRFKNIDETRHYFLEEIEQNELISRKHKVFCPTLNYIELFLILSFSITGCISISTFTSLLGISIGITNSAIGLKICAVIAGIKSFN